MTVGTSRLAVAVVVLEWTTEPCAVSDVTKKSNCGSRSSPFYKSVCVGWLIGVYVREVSRLTTVRGVTRD